MESYESVLLVKSETMVYKIPPRTTNRGHRAADWNLNEPHWVGRLRLVSKGKDCVLKLEDKTTGELFAKCPIDQYPGIAIESVTDSSRYFVIRIQDDGGHQIAGRSAFIGLGFADRSDSFDLNVALQDHFKWLKKSEEIEKEKEEPKQELDLRFKEGETIKINMKITKKDGSEVVSRPKTKSNTSTGILPPPPGGVKIAPPPAGSSKNSPATTPSHSAQLPVAGSANLLFDAGQAEASGSSGGASPVQPRSGTGESWGDFTSARSTTPASQPSAPPANSNWVQF